MTDPDEKPNKEEYRVPSPSQVGSSPPAPRKIRPRLEIVDTTGEPNAAGSAPTGRTVLLVESDPELRAKVRTSLPESYELVTAQAGEAGLRAARLCGPDLILFDPMTGGEDTLDRLGADPLTCMIPIIPLLGQESDGVSLTHPELLDPVARPLNVVELRGRITAAVEEPAQEGVSRVIRGDLGDASLAEVIEFVHLEIDRWVLDAAGPGAGEDEIELGQSGLLMGALWSFIARLRELVSKGSDGEISFPEHGGEDRISMLTLSGGAYDEEVGDGDVVDTMATAERIERLQGLRAVVADDDPAVRKAFGTILTEVGMEVEAVADGREALAAFERCRPDIVITDILMPGMDGWELLRRIRRDIMLRDIPVVILSWKEDFLQRMRELGANADEYMRKELDRDQILLRLSGVLAPRNLMEDRLDVGEEEVAGRVEATGIVPLLRAMARIRGESRLVVREAWNLFMVDFHDGQLVRLVNKTEAGRKVFSRDALSLLLGVSRGRYVVTERMEEIEQNIDGGFERAMVDVARKLQTMIDQVAEGAILRVARVELDADQLEEYVQLAPAELKQVIHRLAAGDSPRELILEGVSGPQELERIVLDLVRRGVVTRIEAPLPKAKRVTQSNDEERWAVIGGEKADVPPEPDPHVAASPAQIDSAAPLSGRDQKPIETRSSGGRAWIYLAIVAVVALLIGYCAGQLGSRSSAGGEDSPPPQGPTEVENSSAPGENRAAHLSTSEPTTE